MQSNKRKISKTRICAHKLTCKKPTFVLYRPKYDLHRIKWEINPFDNDKNINWSIPHGDDIYPSKHTLKLDVYTGEIKTVKNRKLYGWLTQKELKRLHSDKHFKRVVQQAIDNYNSPRKYKSALKCHYVFEAFCMINKPMNNRRK